MVSLGNSVGFEGIRFGLLKLFARYLYINTQAPAGEFTCFIPLLLHFNTGHSESRLQLRLNNLISLYKNRKHSTLSEVTLTLNMQLKGDLLLFLKCWKSSLTV